MNAKFAQKPRSLTHQSLWMPINSSQSAEIAGGHQKIDLRVVCGEGGCVIWNMYDMLPPGL